MYSKAAVLLALACSSFAFAQDDLPPIPGPELDPLPLVAPRPTAIYTPLTPEENFRYGLNRVFSPGKLLLFGAEAAMDQEREVPSRWAEGGQWYGARYADRFGRALVRENVAFAVRAMTGEDPRYEMSHESGIWKRSQHAVISTFVVRGRDGHLIPAYSRFISTYATPIIAEQWKSEPLHVRYALSAGTGGIGIAIAANLAAEFWPDIRRRFLRH